MQMAITPYACYDTVTQDVSRRFTAGRTHGQALLYDKYHHIITAAVNSSARVVRVVWSPRGVLSDAHGIVGLFV